MSHQPPFTGQKNSLPLLIAAFLVVTANILLDYLAAPNGILLTPIAVATAVWLISFSSHKPLPKTLLATGLVSLHDCGIKIFGGGMHDMEGAGVIAVFLLGGALLSYVGLVAGIALDKKAGARIKILAIGLFPALVTAHLYLTANLGMGRCINC